MTIQDFGAIGELTGAIDFNNLTGFINEPRTFGLQLTARYD